MGHGKSDRLYVTPAEHSGIYGAHGASSGKHTKQEGDNYQPLPFDCCAISLQPWSHPVCSTDDGTVFELTNVIPFLRKYRVNPATGAPLSPDQLVTLHFHRNERGNWHDPVSFKEFGPHTHLVAIATSGNVYAAESVQRLNLKPKHMRDLLTDEPFKKTDIITLQDPHNAQSKDVSKLHHVKLNLVVTEADRGVADDDEVNIAATGSAGALLAKLRAEREAKGKDEAAIKKTAKPPAANQETSTSTSSSSLKTDSAYARNKGKSGSAGQTSTSASTGLTAASFTSTALTPRTQTERVSISEEEAMFDSFRSRTRGKGEKGYARLSTNYGPLNIELHCDRAPRACFNFLQLCKRGAYDGVVFHRNIPGFMIQGGDPTGTGSGGSSVWGKDFADEYDYPGALTHSARGTLSMANRGPGTNSSQFFLTYRATPHLDRKHTVFGRLVDGEKDETLEKLERLPNKSGTDRPAREIKILETLVSQDPFERYLEGRERRKRREDPESEESRRREEKRRRREDDRTTWLGTNLDERQTAAAAADHGGSRSASAAGVGGVGKYLAAASAASSKTAKVPPPSSAAARQQELGGGATERKKTGGGGGFGDFSGW